MEDPRKLEEGFGTSTQFTSKDEDHHSKKDISNENEQKSMTTSDMPEEQPLVKQKTKRVATLDAFRGLTIVVRKSYCSKRISYFLVS